MQVRRTGGIERYTTKGGRAYFRGRIRLADGSRERVDVPESFTDESAARAFIAAVQEGEDREHGFLERKRARAAAKLPEAAPTAVTEGESVAAYFQRRTASRHIKSAKDERGRMVKWVLPEIGALAIAAVTATDLQRLVAKLDDAAREERLSGKTAKNVWGHVTKMMSDACRSKIVELRVRADNPCLLVEGPEPGHTKDEPFLSPAEFLALVTSERTPVRWARIFALTAYLYVRRGELEALECSDVHLGEGYVNVHRAVDKDGNTGRTKTSIKRKVPIEPTLRPLLEVILREAHGEGPLVRMPPPESLSSTLRRYLEWGAVTREDLFVGKEDPTRRRIVFHSLRDTGITWRAIRGDDPLKIQRAAGHTDFATTQGYIKAAEVFDRLFGEPFPVLPERLLHPLYAVGRANNGPTQNRRPETLGKTAKETGVPSGSRTLRGGEQHEDFGALPCALPSGALDERAENAIVSDTLGPTLGQLRDGLEALRMVDFDAYAYALKEAAE